MESLEGPRFHHSVVVLSTFTCLNIFASGLKTELEKFWLYANFTKMVYM